jgi:hypothetical protein
MGFTLPTDPFVVASQAEIALARWQNPRAPADAVQAFRKSADTPPLRIGGEAFAFAVTLLTDDSSKPCRAQQGLRQAQKNPPRRRLAALLEALEASDPINRLSRTSRTLDGLTAGTLPAWDRTCSLLKEGCGYLAVVPCCRSPETNSRSSRPHEAKAICCNSSRRCPMALCDDDS